jgi:heme/copper-type cytochrome/quinol oxidase subunit 4
MKPMRLMIDGITTVFALFGVYNIGAFMTGLTAKITFNSSIAVLMGVAGFVYLLMQIYFLYLRTKAFKKEKKINSLI